MSSEIVLHFGDLHPVELLGENNRKLDIIKDAFPELHLSVRGNQIRIAGHKKTAQKAKSQIELLARILKQNKELSIQTVQDVVRGANPMSHSANGKDASAIVHGWNGKPIRARTVNQKLLVESSESNDIVFAVGPAGTGKTYTAVALAVRALKNRHVKRIILTRPAVEAGESLGFLPGDLKEKIDPYLRPLYDALDDMFPSEKLEKFIEDRTIEIAPLAFMRGRTLNDAFIILDEAQNATGLQLKMFLTRLGPSAKCIITGDLTQIDLPHSSRSGLRYCIKLLRNIDGVGLVELDSNDVVRHRLVKQIILAYDRERNRKMREDSEE